MFGGRVNVLSALRGVAGTDVKSAPTRGAKTGGGCTRDQLQGCRSKTGPNRDSLGIRIPRRIHSERLSEW